MIDFCGTLWRNNEKVYGNKLLIIDVTHHKRISMEAGCRGSDAIATNYEYEVE